PQLLLTIWKLAKAIMSQKMAPPVSPSKRSAAPPPPNKSRRSRPKHQITVTEDIICRGNTHLLAGRNRQAIELYTDVLYTKSPGHIIAFLNRSLAYVCDNPDLAVIDAYRAGVLIQSARSNNRRAHQRRSEIMHYFRTESICAKAGHPWTRVGHMPLKNLQHFKHIVWADAPLATLLIGINPDLVTKSDYYCNRLEARAVYLLCGALYQLNAGAAHEALGIISDALRNCRLTAEEDQHLKGLGDRTLNGLTDFAILARDRGKEMDDEDLILLPQNGTMGPVPKPEVSAKTRLTNHPVSVYWGDMHQPDYSRSKTHVDLMDCVAAVSQTCTPFVRDLSRYGVCAVPGLQASKDLYPGDTILYERSPWHVTTSAPAVVLEAWQKNKAGQLRLYCDTCATALLLPDDFVMEMMFQAPPQSDVIKTSPDSPTEGNNDQDSKDLEHKNKVKAIASAHISFCHEQHQSSYCSTACRRLRRAFDPGIHEEVMEHELRTEKHPTELPPLPGPKPSHPRSEYSHSKAQIIYDLLFLRIYASALNEDQHPLELTRFFRMKARMPDSNPPNPLDIAKGRAPWSFHNNVVRPINSINRYHAALKQDPFQYLEQSDGWVINTLLHKIHQNVVISRGAMSAFTLNVRKESKTWRHRGFEPWVGENAVYQSEQELDEVWVGQINPVVNMITYANEKHGEKPNCWLRYDQGVRVIAGQPDDPPDKTSVAIKKDGMLLQKRPAFMGGSPFEITEYTQKTPGSPSSNGNANRDEVFFDDDMDEDGEDEKSIWNSSDSDDSDDSDDDAENPTVKNGGETGSESMDLAEDSDELLDFAYTDSNPSTSSSGDNASAGSPVRGNGTPPTSPPPIQDNTQQPESQAEPINKPLRLVLRPPRPPPLPLSDGGDMGNMGGS
ncbi:MAG: hypothetical protein Q9224_005562, partial [Gallowayella concinna]